MNKIILALICLNLTLLWPSQAAIFYTWNAGSGNWTNAANWTPNGVPSPADSAIISNGVVVVGIDTAIADIALTGGTLGGSGNLNVTRLMNWTGGSIAGALTVASNGVMNITGAALKNLYAAMTNAGTVVWSGSGYVQVFNSSCGYNGAIYNLAGGLFEIQNDQVMYDSGCGVRAELFSNAGTVRKSGGSGTTTISPRFVNSGTVNIRSGLVAFNGAFTPTGSSVLAIGIGGLIPGTQYGRMQVASAVTLTGLLQVDLLNDFIPGLGSTFTVVTYGSHTGTFAALIGDGRFFEPQYNSTSLVLTTTIPPGGTSSRHQWPTRRNQRRAGRDSHLYCFSIRASSVRLSMAIEWRKHFGGYQ